MSVRIRGDWDNLKKTLLKASKVSIRDKLAKPAGAALVTSTRERFRTSRGPDGKPWKPLSATSVKLGFRKRDYTKSGRLRKGVAEREAKRLILVQSARLKNSISFKAEDTAVAVGTNVVYGRVHQLGGKAGRGRKVTIPARPFLGVSKSDEAELDRLTVQCIREAFK